ncbi:MAG: AAA family ATPase, partial [Pyrinomonadaceae bacterium]
MSTLLETLGSYVPSMIVGRANADPARFTEPTVERFSAAVLFADISGFSALTERLAARGPAGIEDLTTLLNSYFGQLIDLVEEHGGDIVKFAGDAVLALWPVAEGRDDLPEQIERVGRCCLKAQERLHEYPVADDVRLSLKLAVGAGDVSTVTLGGVFERWEFLVAGAPLAQVGVANSLAAPGEIVLAPEAAALTRDRCLGREASDGHLYLAAVRGGMGEETLSPRRREAPIAEAAQAVRAFIPAAIRARLDAGQTDWLAELRKVTVLFINLPDFGYETPVEQAQAVMRALQASLYRYEGSINKISVDDKGASLVCALGLPPLTHEDDPARGARAALAMQAELRRAGLRSSVGVTTGLAFCGSVGNAVRREYTLMGHVVNRAARLMQAAAGDILCDAPTAQSAAGRLVFESLPPLKLKGMTEPVAVFRPSLKADDVPAQVCWLKPRAEMVGREKERELLATRLRALVDQKQGTRIVIEGEPGIGKSRLAEELRARAQEVSGVRVLSGAGDSIERATPYHAWREVFSQLFELSELSGDPALGQTRVANRLPPDPEVFRLAPLLNVVLPLQWADNEFTQQLAGKVRADQTHELLLRLLQDAAAASPLALIVEDLHWLDSGSLALLLVTQRVSPVLVCATTRPLGDPLPADYGALLRAEGTEHIVLDTLTPEETLALACRRLGVASLPEPVAALVRDRAEGNPFFCEEMVLAMRDSGLLSIAGGQCRLKTDVTDTLTWNFPDTIQGVITNRIDRLTPEQQLTMKVASVIGRVFAYPTLHDVHPIDADRRRLPEHFDVLQRLDLTPLEQPMPHLTYIFKHAITHEVAYNLMLFSQRRQLHRAVAEWYEQTHAEDLSPYYPYLAYHWRRAAEDRVPDPSRLWKAIAYLHKSGDQAVRNYVNQEG